MKLKNLVFLFVFFLFSCSEFDYLWTVSKGQLELMSRRVPISTALEKYEFTEEEKKKLKLVAELKTFAVEKLKMDIDKGVYSSYIQLDEDYVSYLLRVSLADELKAYNWDFPIVGSFSYKGFFDKKLAKKAAETFSKEKYDVFIRGVTAYSTLGWFEDAILSSFLSYSESSFVTVIFHELAHTVLFFKDHIDFNERFAEFLGRKAALLFYLDKEGKDSEQAQNLLLQWEDELLFSSFMLEEYNKLDQWYKDNKATFSPEIKKIRLKEIQNRFIADIQPQLKTERYNYFPKIELNNAILLAYRSYNYNMDEFEKLFNSPLINKNISAFIEYCSQFKDEKNPEIAFSQAVKELLLKWKYLNSL